AVSISAIAAREERRIRWGEAVRAQSTDVQGGMLVVSHTKSRKVSAFLSRRRILAELEGRVGRLMGLTNAQTLALRVRDLADVAGFRVHRCRHTFACHWLEHGGSLAALQEILGHS